MRMRRVSFGTYPYTATRAKVMKSDLLTGTDYLRMRNMGVAEIARTLEEGQYREEITRLRGSHRGVELVEQAAKENLARTARKLLLVAHRPEVRELLAAYTMRWVANNLKLVLKARMGVISAEEALSLIVPIPPTDQGRCQSLLKEDSSKVLDRAASLLGVDRRLLGELYEKKRILEMENEMDKRALGALARLARRMPSSRDPLKRFLKDLVALTNIRTIIRMKARKVEVQAIRLHLIAPLGAMEAALLGAGDARAAAGLLKGTRFAVLAEADPGRLDALSEKFLYRTAFMLLHRHPLGIGPVFGFLLLKELEVRNLRLLAHARALGLGKEFLDEELLVG